MAFVHGKGTVVSIDSDSMTAFSNEVQFKRSMDAHDVTTFGKNAKVFKGGLADGTATINGTYDSTASTGPSAVFNPLVKSGAVVEMVFQPEGLGSGKPTATVDVIVTAYETTSPVADMITWSAEVQFSDDVADTVQAP